MNAEVYAQWLQSQGQRVVQTCSSYWQSDGFGVYQAFPYHKLIEPSPEELEELAWKHHAVALRFSTAPIEGSVAQGYHAVYTGTDYDFAVLSTKARTNVRRGLRSCTIGQISRERYVEEGWDLRVDTLSRQGRLVHENRETWRKRSWVPPNLQGFEFWAAEVDGKLAATVLTFRMDDWFYLVYQQCHRNYLRAHVNNALSFTVTQTLVRRANVKGIFYGLRSLDAPASVDAFKFQMGYEAKPVRQKVVFHPYLAPWMNGFTHRLSKALVALNPGSRHLAKAEGMLRQYLTENQIIRGTGDARRNGE